MILIKCVKEKSTETLFFEFSFKWVESVFILIKITDNMITKE